MARIAGTAQTAGTRSAGRLSDRHVRPVQVPQTGASRRRWCRCRCRQPRVRNTCCAGSNGRSSAVSTACCRATTARCCAAPAWTWPTCANTSMHDDVRHIDWNVTARLQIPHVRVFTEDREMAAWFLLDLSPSVDFGSGEQRKRNVSAEFVTVLARMLTRHGNRVGALLYGSGVDTVMPARGGRMHVLQLLHAMQTRPVTAESGGTRLARAAAFGARPRSGGARRCSWCPTSSASRAGKSRWASWRSATTWSRSGCSTRWSSTCPTSAWCRSATPKPASRLLVDTHDAGFRKRFARIAAQREAELRQAFVAGRRRHAGTFDRRRPRTGSDAFRRPAQTPQPALWRQRRGYQYHGAAA